MGSWDFETGLPDDFDLEITNAYFNFSPKLTFGGGEPKVGLHLEGKAEGGTFEAPTMLEGETALLAGIGDKWMVTDNGARIVDEGGRDRSFHVNSAITRLLKSAVEAGAPLRERGEATEAKIWVGLKLHFKRKTVKMGGDIGDREVLFVDKYLGEAEQGGSTKAAAAPAKAQATTTTTTTTTADASDDVELIKGAAGGAIFKRLERLAKESDDYDTFASEAVELPKIKDDDGAQDIILDDDRGKALYETLRG